MAPALLETQVPTSLSSSTSDYKQFGTVPRTFDKSKEVSAKYQKYLPTWDQKQKYYPYT